MIALGKPFGIPEVGSATCGGTKAAWIADYYSWLSGQDAIKTSAFFDFDDLGVFGGADGNSVFQYTDPIEGTAATYNVYAEHQTAVGNSWLIGSNQANPQLMTDAQFLGQ